jgi:hypothetical protein
MQGLREKALYYAKLTLRVDPYFQILPSNLLSLTFKHKAKSINVKQGTPKLSQARVVK